ncbi:hypothetical protein ABBQ32_008921 [Trebouxia sp. C0010 RCD-2024]
MVLPEARTPLLHDPNGSGVIGRQGSESIDDYDGRAEVIYVPEGFEVREGLKLTKDYKVGKELGGGHQGAVYELLDGKGKDSGQVLKALKAKKAAPITGADIGLKREWLIGQQLNSLSKDGKDLPGFMFTGAAVVSGAGDGNTGMLEGLIIEKLNGWDIEKRICRHDFQDAAYLMDMIKQVLTSLDRAFTKLGFTHADMRISNVMEHHLDAEPMYPKGFTSRKQRKAVGVLTEPKVNNFNLPGQKPGQQVHFKIIDYGHAKLSNHKVHRKLPKIPVFEQFYQKVFANKGDVWRLLNSLSDVVDGRTWPENQEPQVKALNGLIREVTGIKPHAFWKPLEANGDSGKGKRAGVALNRPNKKKYRKGLPWQRHNGFGHRIRKFVVNTRAFMFPKKPHMTPAEALSILAKLEAASKPESEESYV